MESSVQTIVGRSEEGGTDLLAGPVPLYYQLEQSLRERILGGEFAKGEALPTEDQICCEYKVSRITVRRALSGLAQHGLIERRRGVGSFVSEKLHGINSHLTGSLSEFLAVAGTLTTHQISFGEATPSQEILELLGQGAGESARLLCAVGELEEGAVAYLEIWFPSAVGELLVPEELTGRIPVALQVEKAINAKITRAEQTIKPDRAGDLAGRHLDIEADTPVLRVRRSYFVGSRLIEVADVVYHPERYSYAIEFKG